MVFIVSFPPCTTAICPRDGMLLCYEFHYILHLLADILAEVYYVIDTILYGLNTNEIWRIPFVLISSGLGRYDVLQNFIVLDLSTNEQESLLAESSFNTKNFFFLSKISCHFILTQSSCGFLFSSSLLRQKEILSFLFCIVLLVKLNNKEPFFFILA